ncbi:MAG: amidohydrolase family protein [Pseudomonadales bacterium]
MRLIRLILRVVIVGIALTGGLTVMAGQWALVPDRVVDGVSDRPLVGLAVLVEGRRITGLVPVREIPTDFAVIGLPGTTLMPGLINAHEHPLMFDDRYQDAHLSGSSAYKALLGLATLQRLLTHGWTSIRVMGDADVFYGNQDLQRVISEGIFLGPRITGAAHYISITGGGGDINYGSPEQTLIADGLIADGPEEIRKAIRREIKYGSDWIKLLVTGAFLSVGDDPKNVAFSPEELAAAVAEAARHNVPVAAHAHATEGINQAVRAGVRSIEHGSYLTDESIALMVEHGTFYVPTIYIGDYYANTNKLQESDKNDSFYRDYRQSWLEMIGRAHKAGVKIVVGVDLGGYNIPPNVYAREFATLVEAGMSPMASLKAGTSVAADLLGWSDRVGRVQPGLLADLVAFEGNPLEDISVLEQTAFVMKDGLVVKGGLSLEDIAAQSKGRGRPLLSTPISLNPAN